MRKNKAYLRRKRLQKAIKAAIFTLVGVMLMGTAAGALYVNHLLNQLDYDTDDTWLSESYPTDRYGNIILPGDNPADPTDPGQDSDKPDGGNNGTGGTQEPAESTVRKPVETDQKPAETEYQPVDEPEASKIAEQAQDAAADTTPIQSSKDVINILLIGVDSRAPGGQTNSDVMMLLSINKAKKKITLSSLMRDLYVSIPGVGNTKMNHANAIGGPNLLLKTVQSNFRIEVQQYMLVDFYSMADIVDILGGVTVNVIPEEVPLINSSVRMTNARRGLPAEHGILETSGTVNLTGPQAVGYARIRYVGNADFGRTKRQRTIMDALFRKVKGSSISTLNALALQILPQIKTNMDRGQVLSYLTLIPQAAGYPVQQLQIPAPGAFYSANVNGLDSLVPDLAKNRELLRNTIY